MKSLFKKVGKAGWRSTGIVRRPIMRKIEGLMRRWLFEEAERLRGLLNQQIFEQGQHVVATLQLTAQQRHHETVVALDQIQRKLDTQKLRQDELDIVVEGVLREVLRLQQRFDGDSVARPHSPRLAS
jgi:hypothetical protein